MEMLTAEKKVAPRTVNVNRRRERVFYTGMAAAFVLTVFAGFARTYYLRPYFGTPALTPLLHLHGVVFTSWLVLLLAQTVLGGLLLVASHPLRLVVGNTRAWLAFAGWLTSWVG